MKRFLYVETSVVSYLVGRASRDTVIAGHQASTQAFWLDIGERFEPHVSDLVEQEAAKGDPDRAALRLDAIKSFPVLEINDEVEELARHLVTGRAVPEEYAEDAVHIAVAAVSGMDLIVTWNFKHINNPFMKTAIRRVVTEAGYEMPEICSPDELQEAGDE